MYIDSNVRCLYTVLIKSIKESVEMKMRKIASIFMCTILAFSLFGCGTSKMTTSENDTIPAAGEKTPLEDSDSSGSKDKITLRMAWWGSQTRHDRTIEVINLYMQQNPNIKIEHEFYDHEGYFNKLNTLVASDEGWDIFQMGSNFPEYQSKIYALDEFIKDGTVDVSGTTDAFLRIAQDEKGTQVGLCSGVNTYGIAYDPKLFADAGVKEPTENWTWDEFSNACKTIHDKLGIFGFSKMDDWQAGASMGINQEGFDYGFFKNDNSGLGFDDHTMLSDYIKMRADLVKYGAYPDPGALKEISDIENDFLVTGEAAMTWVASNQYIALCKAAGKELKLINPPRKTSNGPAGITVQSSQMLCASKDGKNPAEAAKFIAFFQSNVDANKILLGERGIPTFTAVREALSANLSKDESAVYDYVDRVGSFDTGGKKVNPSSPVCISAIQEKYKFEFDRVVYEEISADQASKLIYEFAAAQDYKSK